MPELPEVERERRRLAPAMVGAHFTRVRLNRADLRTPFPARFAARLRGRTVRALHRRGKYLIAELDADDALVMHLGMSGSFRVEPTSASRGGPEAALERRHDHVVFTMSSGMTVAFNDPRRFGLMTLVPHQGDAETSASRSRQLGPEPLTALFDGASLAARCAGRRVSLKVALLDQRVVAGLGNIYASEALHLARLSPFRRAASVATTTGRPRPAATRLASAIKSVLRRAISMTESTDYRGSRFRVYERDGEACLTPGCGGTIERAIQSGRSTFHCPKCQR
jgi:formamidopyrimidine-DNA glycosylase